MFANVLAQEIWTAKYRFRSPDGGGDDDFAATIARVSNAIAEVEVPEQRDYWRQQFADALYDFRFIPAGRILAGAGTDRSVTLFNCFVMGTIPDSLEGIFAHLREAAITMQQGGGVGMDFSTIRPAGSPVKGVGADASGPLTFMDCWDAMCRTVLSAGQRRGAMMGCLRIDHPDIEAFIDAKRDPTRFRNFNVSVLVTDDFMKALSADAEWQLDVRRPAGAYHSRKRAVGKSDARNLRHGRARRDLRRPRQSAQQPGLLRNDHASNPCGEQMLPPYGACLLGSINLAALVERPFEPDAAINEAELAELTRTAVRMLDNVIDISRYPLPQQEEEAKAKRRIGLGITGLADALLFCGTAYGSGPAVALTRRWLEIIKREAYRASAELAAEKGPFPLYEPGMLERPNVAGLDDETRALIAKHGLRNGCLTSIAPTGTTSLLAGNVSSGIEPVFAYSYHRQNPQRRWLDT